MSRCHQCAELVERPILVDGQPFHVEKCFAAVLRRRIFDLELTVDPSRLEAKEAYLAGKQFIEVLRAEQLAARPKKRAR